MACMQMLKGIFAGFMLFAVEMLVGCFAGILLFAVELEIAVRCVPCVWPWSQRGGGRTV